MNIHLISDNLEICQQTKEMKRAPHKLLMIAFEDFRSKESM